ncbi:MAG: Na+/H+ antiporter subunit E [Desulfurococcaceae archaeon]
MIYIVFSGSYSIYDLATGLITAVFVGILFSNITLKDASKPLNPRRWYYLLRYALRYFIVDETKAHVDVIKRILHPKAPVNPAIVKVPFNVQTDYAKTAVACSICNTPGTIVVEVDESEKVFYVHWIDAKTLEPTQAREQISRVFEEYSGKIFD